MDINFTGIDARKLDINLRHIYYFLVIADAESISQAAQKLYLQQPMLSKNLRTLEDQLGIRLFERRGRKMILTTAGRYLYNEWKKLILHFHENIQYMEILNKDLPEKIRLGCYPVIDALDYLKKYTDVLYEKYPDIFVEFQRMNYNRLLEFLNSNLADAIVLRRDDMPEDKSPYEWQVIAEECLVAAVPSEHPLGKRKTLYLKDLEKEKLLFSDPAGNLSRGGNFLHECHEKGISYGEIEFVNNDLTALLNARYGKGIAIGTRDAFSSRFSEVKIQDIQDMSVEIVAVWKKTLDKKIKGMLESVFCKTENEHQIGWIKIEK